MSYNNYELVGMDIYLACRQERSPVASPSGGGFLFVCCCCGAGVLSADRFRSRESSVWGGKVSCLTRVSQPSAAICSEVRYWSDPKTLAHFAKRTSSGMFGSPVGAGFLHNSLNFCFNDSPVRHSTSYLSERISATRS